MKGFTLAGCSRICSCQSLREPHETTENNKAAATGSVQSTCNHQISTGFNRLWRSVRDQGISRRQDARGLRRLKRNAVPRPVQISAQTTADKPRSDSPTCSDEKPVHRGHAGAWPAAVGFARADNAGLWFAVCLTGIWTAAVRWRANSCEIVRQKCGVQNGVFGERARVNPVETTCMAAWGAAN